MRNVFQRVNTTDVDADADIETEKSPVTTKAASTSILLRILLILIVGVGTLAGILALVATIPGLSLPSSLEDAKHIVQVLRDYIQNNEEGHSKTFIIFTLLYLWKQTFCVPGTILLNLIAGALYGMSTIPLLCFLTALGSTLCYYIFYFAGADILEHYIPERLDKLRGQIDQNRSRMFLYLMTIRLFPFAPYWLINIVSPFVGVPVWSFFITCMLGIIPYNFVTIEAGEMLSEVESVSDILNPWFIIKLLVVSVVPLLLSFIGKRKHKEEDVENPEWEEEKDVEPLMSEI
ncbi:hypothetical protein K493DRAFT_201667 [Basidiobolus meristosporus CBS 931.73]|uniref:VTT domain-containing protein n=1 Tax=Basidiobolus meristosporus CBS 931.73 TaxID=1314790 RepID=A0A1Y1ZCE2_9FUNG|nr:hypothetical protein K493DRAFT_201667 [Basidiobolus meristosporus CBS 931.73]|eukprot:ORY07886.1 hypothetical protein K493DRAFT_201667 [Basidiobolus meristosporus CBS 931.73]